VSPGTARLLLQSPAGAIAPAGQSPPAGPDPGEPVPPRARPGGGGGGPAGGLQAASPAWRHRSRRALALAVPQV